MAHCAGLTARLASETIQNPVPAICRDRVFCYMDENSPLSGEFQKGEAYPHQKAALLCYKKDVLTFSVAKESNNG